MLQFRITAAIFITVNIKWSVFSKQKQISIIVRLPKPKIFRKFLWLFFSVVHLDVFFLLTYQNSAIILNIFATHIQRFFFFDFQLSMKFNPIWLHSHWKIIIVCCYPAAAVTASAATATTLSPLRIMYYGMVVPPQTETCLTPFAICCFLHCSTDKKRTKQYIFG